MGDLPERRASAGRPARTRGAEAPRPPRPGWAALASVALALLPAGAPAAAGGPGAATGEAGQDVAWIWPGAALPAPLPGELAVLTETVLLRAGAAERRPLRTPLATAPGTRVTTVVHVQPARDLDRLTPEQAEVVVAEVTRAARQSTSGWVQLDFEAPGALREAWRRLVAEARRALPPGVRLSVTVQAGWCSGGAWLDGLEADEVVPMLFALGPGAGRWHRAFLDGAGTLHPRCLGGAGGFSVEAPPPAPVRHRYPRRYWFHERPQRPYALPGPEVAR